MPFPNPNALCSVYIRGHTPGFGPPDFVGVPVQQMKPLVVLNQFQLDRYPSGLIYRHALPAFPGIDANQLLFGYLTLPNGVAFDDYLITAAQTVLDGTETDYIYLVTSLVDIALALRTLGMPPTPLCRPRSCGID